MSNACARSKDSSWHDGDEGTTRLPDTEPGSLALQEIIVGTISQPSETVTDTRSHVIPVANGSLDVVGS